MSGLRFFESVREAADTWLRIKRQVDQAYEKEAEERYRKIFGPGYTRMPFTWQPTYLETQAAKLLPTSLWNFYALAKQAERAHEAAKAHPVIGPAVREITHAAGNVINWIQKWTELSIGTAVGALLSVPAAIGKERGIVLPPIAPGTQPIVITPEQIREIWQKRQEQNLMEPGPSPIDYNLKPVKLPETTAEVFGNAPAVYLNILSPWERLAVEFVAGFFVDPLVFAGRLLGSTRASTASRIALKYFPNVADELAEVTALDRAAVRLREVFAKVEEVPVAGWLLRPTPAHEASDAARDAVVYGSYLTQIAENARPREFTQLVNAFLADPTPFVGESKAARALTALFDEGVDELPSLARAIEEGRDVNFPQFISEFARAAFYRKAETLGRLKDGVWQETFDERLTRWLREVESVFLLGLPRYAIRNFANNTLTTLVDGVNPFASYEQSARFLKHFPLAQQDLAKAIQDIDVPGRDAFTRMIAGEGKWQRFVPLSTTVRRWAREGKLGDMPFGELPFRVVVQSQATQRHWDMLWRTPLPNGLPFALRDAAAAPAPIIADEGMVRIIRQAMSYDEIVEAVDRLYAGRVPLAALGDWEFLTPILPDLEQIWQSQPRTEWFNTLDTLERRVRQNQDLLHLLHGPLPVQPDDVRPVIGEAVASTIVEDRPESIAIAHDVAASVQEAQDDLLKTAANAISAASPSSDAVERVLQIYQRLYDQFNYAWADAYRQANVHLNDYYMRVEYIREAIQNPTQQAEMRSAAWHQYVSVVRGHWQRHFQKLQELADTGERLLANASSDLAEIPVVKSYQIEDVPLVGDPEFTEMLRANREELRQARDAALNALGEYLGKTGNVEPMHWLASLIKQEAEYVANTVAIIRDSDTAYFDVPRLWEALHHDQMQLWKLFRRHIELLDQGIRVPPRWNEITALQLFTRDYHKVSFLNELAKQAGIPTATAEGKPIVSHLARFLNKAFEAVGLPRISDEAMDSLVEWDAFVRKMDEEQFLAAYRALMARAHPAEETPISLFDQYVTQLKTYEARVQARQYYRWLINGRRGPAPDVEDYIRTDLDELVRVTHETPIQTAPPTGPLPTEAAQAVQAPPGPAAQLPPTPEAVSPAITAARSGAEQAPGAVGPTIPAPPIRQEGDLTYLDINGHTIVGEPEFLRQVWELWNRQAAPSLLDPNYDRLYEALRTTAVARFLDPVNGTAGAPPVLQAQREALEAALTEIARLRDATETFAVPVPAVPKEVIMEWLDENVRPRMAAAKAVASLAGQSFADRTLLDYSATRNFDRILQLFFPYHFWTTRTAFNWAKRFLHNPISVAAYLEMRETIAEQRRQDVGLRQRFHNKIRVPFPFLPDYFEQALYFDPFRLAIPFADLSLSDWDDVDKANNAFFKILAAGDAFGLAPHIPHRLLMDFMMGETGGLADYIPQASLVSAMLPPNMYTSGPGWLGSRWNAYRINRMLASMAADELKIPNLDYNDLREIVAASRYTGKVDLKPILPYLEAQILVERWARGEMTQDEIDAMFTNPLIREAMRRVWGERLLPSVTSAFLGLPISVVATGERIQVATQKAMQMVSELASQGREALQEAIGTPAGRATIEAILGANPFIRARQAQYGVIPEEEGDTAKQIYRRTGLDVTLNDIEAKWRPLIEQSVREDPANFTQLDKILDAYFDERQKAFAQWLDDQRDPRLRSIYGATPEEVAEIRRLDILSIVAKTRPKRDQFAAPDAMVDGKITADEIDWDAYHAAYDKWLQNLVAIGLQNDLVIQAARAIDRSRLPAQVLAEILTPQNMRYYIDEHLRLIDPYTALTETIRDLYNLPYQKRREEAIRRFGPDILERYEQFTAEVEKRYGSDIWARLDAYFNEVHGRFDLPGTGWQGVRDIFQIQDQFFTVLESIVGKDMIELGRQYGRLPKGSEERRKMLSAHPELRAYWEIRESLLAQEPFQALRPYWNARRALMEKYGLTQYFDEIDALEAKYNIQAYRDERSKLRELFPEFLGGHPQQFIQEVLSRYPWFRERGWDEEYLARIYEEVADIPDANIIRLINEAERSGVPLEDLMAAEAAKEFLGAFGDISLPTTAQEGAGGGRRRRFFRSSRRRRRFRFGGGGGGRILYRPFLPSYSPGAIQRRRRIYIP
jgi:hypothetical protein